MRGRVVPATPAMVEATRARDRRLLDDLLAGTAGLPEGRTHGGTIPPYRQANQRTCFYAALLAIRNVHARRQFDAADELRVIGAAEDEGLLSPYGAETGMEFSDRQVAFVHRWLELRIGFVQQSDLRIASELSGALQSGRQVVLGRAAPLGGSGVGHWLGLDGVNKYASGEVNFTGMDTAVGRCVECSVDAVHRDLLKFAMPLVVVEGYSPRFQPTQPAPSFQRFRPAS